MDAFPALGAGNPSFKVPLAPVSDPSNNQCSYAASLTAPSKAQSMAQKPAMRHTEWSELSKRIPCMQDFKLGPAPAPLPYDTYVERWLKLVWMEEYYSMLQFMQDHVSLDPAQFNHDAFLTIKVNSFDQDEEAYRVTVRGTDPARDYALPDDMALPGDFSQAILKLPKGLGWIYLIKIFAEGEDANNKKIQESHDVCTKKLLKSMQARSAGGKQEKMEAMAEIYTENFDQVLGSLPPQWRTHRRCIVFDSFSTCIRRFHALHQYPSKVHKELRKYIEASISPSPSHTELQGPRSARQSSRAEPEYQGPLLRPVPTSGSKAASTKLNEVQHTILQNLKTPLDFVQGPPGTGKSFFIVELLRTRIPPDRKVLLCTTTNKAIDSLAEKICSTCGHDSVIAIGNAHRLGATSVTLTLDEKVKRHRSKQAWLDMCVKATYVMEAYTNIQQNALIEARKKDQEEAKGRNVAEGGKFTVNEEWVAASMAAEMGAAARAAEEVARVKLAASRSTVGQHRQGRGTQGSSSTRKRSDEQSDEDDEAGDRRDLKAMTETSQGVLAQSVRPHVRSLRRMLQAVQVAAKKFVAEIEHPDILLGWIWDLLPDMEWFLGMKLRVSVGLLEEFKVFSSNVLVLNSGTVDKLLRLHFLRSSRYVVCTAASAANLSSRAERDIGSIRKGLVESALDNHSVLRLLACECSNPSGPSGGCRSGGAASNSGVAAAACAVGVAQVPSATGHIECSGGHALPGLEAPQLHAHCSSGGSVGASGQGSAADAQARQLCERTHDMLAQMGSMSISTEPCSSTAMQLSRPNDNHVAVASLCNHSGTPGSGSANHTGAANNRGSSSSSFVYRTYACSECRRKVQHALQNMPALLKLCRLRRVPAGALGDLEEAVAAAEDSGEDNRRQRMMKQMLSFHHVVLDEAGAMLQPDMVGTVIHGCRFLLCVGDHLQLPPFTQWKKAADYAYNVSLLQHLAQRPGVPADHNLMVMQYRMHPHIATIVSDIFYGGRLVTATPVIAARRRAVPVQFVDVAGSEQSQGTSFRNIQEARTVVEIVRAELLNNSTHSTQPSTPPMLTSDSRGRENGAAGAVVVHSDMYQGGVLQGTVAHQQAHRGGRPMSIDVIAFHRPQVYAIRDALDRLGLSRLAKIDVTTVDAMQGREADVVILSCVRSGDRRTLGFLTNRNRLNVALSRARESLYIVGNGPALRSYGKAAWAAVLGHAHVVHNT